MSAWATSPWTTSACSAEPSLTRCPPVRTLTAIDQRRCAMPFRRIAGFAGLIGVVLLIVNTVVAGQPPEADASAAEVLEYYADYEWMPGLVLSALIGPA